MKAHEAKELVVQAGRRLLAEGLIARTWGNVSCRINDNSFAITPRGRDYMSLTPEDIVEVQIEDCSYKGEIKPSSEKGIHAEVYKLRPEINFVIHTHQNNASAISAAGILSISNENGKACIGEKVLCADYALPGTKKLKRNVAKVISDSKSKAVIMRNHGALCFGIDYEEAFLAASELEDICSRSIEKQYLKISRKTDYDEFDMIYFALSNLVDRTITLSDNIIVPYCESQRTEKGFNLFIKDRGTIEVCSNMPDGSLPREAQLYKTIYEKRKDINHIIHMVSTYTAAVSNLNTTLRPYLDDFAQIAGTSVKTVEDDPEVLCNALKAASAVLIKNYGALCCGNTRGDAEAVGMVMEKNCKALVTAALYGNAKPLSPIECTLMRLVYLKKYSKLQFS